MLQEKITVEHNIRTILDISSVPSLFTALSEVNSITDFSEKLDSTFRENVHGFKTRSNSREYTLKFCKKTVHFEMLQENILKSKQGIVPNPHQTRNSNHTLQRNAKDGNATHPLSRQNKIPHINQRSLHHKTYTASTLQ